MNKVSVIVPNYTTSDMEISSHDVTIRNRVLAWCDRDQWDFYPGQMWFD